MYIQSNKPSVLPFTLPKGYSGSAFAPQASEEVQQAAPQTAIEAAREEPACDTTACDGKATVEQNAEDAPTPVDESADGAATAAFAPRTGGARREGGLFARLPFLSSLLPPPRKGRCDKEGLPEWAVLGIVLLLLLDSPENDLLPFLLILLLWE